MLHLETSELILRYFVTVKPKALLQNTFANPLMTRQTFLTRFPTLSCFINLVMLLRLNLPPAVASQKQFFKILLNRIKMNNRCIVNCISFIYNLIINNENEVNLNSKHPFYSIRLSVRLCIS